MSWLKIHAAGIGLLCLSSSISLQAFELPLFAEDARQQGYSLPKAYGLSIGGMSVEQGIDVNSIQFSGLTYPIFGTPIPSDAIAISAAPGKQKSEVYTLRADLWLLPFLNIYAIGGKMSGYSETTVYIDKIGHIPIENNQGLDFRLDLDGNLYGGGVVVAGAIGNWFTLIDASLTKTKLTAIDGDIEALVLSPRVGYDFTENGIPLRVWGGAMYQEVEQHLSGYIHNLALGPVMETLINLVDADKQGRFDVQQRLQTPWNMLIGFQYQFSTSISLLAEAGLGSRTSAMLSLESRF